MFHELLLCLLGHVGDVIILTYDSIALEDGTFKTVDSFKLASDFARNLHPSEITIINELASLGHSYKYIHKFVQDIKIKSSSKGVYLRCFCNGLEDLLAEYVGVVTDIEQTAKKHHEIPPLQQIQSDLSKYSILFPYLEKLVHLVHEKSIQGLAILGELHNRIISCSVHELKIPIQLKAFISQLIAWMIYGLIVDNYSEFFVQKAASKSEKDSLHNTWNTEYVLQNHLIPSFISKEIAEKILFAGRAVQVLQKHRKLEETNSSQKEFLTLEDMNKFTNALKELENSASFQVNQFEYVVEKTRIHVSSLLWKLSVEEGQLLQHLQVLREFFSLSKGEFYQSFIEDSRQIMSFPPKPTAEHDINLIYTQAGSKHVSEDDPYFNLLRLKLVTEEDIEYTYLGGWGGLTIEYKVKWYLDLLLNKEVIDKYNSLFRMLFVLKKVQVELQRIWTIHKQVKKTVAEYSPMFPFWILRKSMSFLIDCLHYYFQFGVIETQYSIMTKKILASSDFEAIKKAHEDFLTISLSQCFVSNRMMLRCLHEIFKMCFHFCTISAREDLPQSLQSIGQISQQFDRQSSVLITFLKQVQNKQPQLEQLLSQINVQKESVK